MIIVYYTTDDKGTYYRKFGGFEEFAYWCLYMGATNHFVEITKVEKYE